MFVQLALSSALLLRATNAECNAIYKVLPEGKVAVVPTEMCMPRVDNYATSSVYECNGSIPTVTVYTTSNCSGDPWQHSHLYSTNYTCVSDAGACSYSTITEDCDDVFTEFYIVTDECESSSDGAYSVMNTCSDDGIMTIEYEGADCSGTVLESEELYNASSCAEVSCYGGSEGSVGSGSNAMSQLYIDVGQRRRNKRAYVCDALKEGLIPLFPFVELPHQQPHEHIPVEPVAAPNSFVFDGYVSLTTKDAVIALLCVMNVVLMAALYCRTRAITKPNYSKVVVVAADTDAEEDQLVE